MPGPWGRTAASPAIKMRRSPTSSCAAFASVAVRRRSPSRHPAAPARSPSRHPAAPARPGSAVALCVRTPRVRPCRPSVRWRDRPCRCRHRASRAPAQFSNSLRIRREFTRTELGFVAFFREMVDQRLIESERHAPRLALRATRSSATQADGVAGSLLTQRMEDDDLVDAVEDSGRKWPRNTSMTSTLVFSYSSSAAPSRLQPSLDDVRTGLDVAMMMVLVKSTTRPLPSVRRPSSNTCSRML